MSAKYYRPILKDGDHLVRSSKNPDRVRGQSRDANNKNPDIVEWEEVEVEEKLDDDDYSYPFDEDSEDDYNYESDGIGDVLGEILGTAAVVGATYLVGSIIDKKEKKKENKLSESDDILNAPLASDASILNAKLAKDEGNANKNQGPTKPNLLPAGANEAFENAYLDMDENEARAHVMSIVYHLIEIAKEIRSLSNAHIRKDGESEAAYLQRVQEYEKTLTDMTTNHINRLLSDEKLFIDVTTSRELFKLFDGGVKVNGKYMPVECHRVREAIFTHE